MLKKSWPVVADVAGGECVAQHYRVLSIASSRNCESEWEGPVEGEKRESHGKEYLHTDLQYIYLFIIDGNRSSMGGVQPLKSFC